MSLEIGERLSGVKFVYFDVGNVLFSFSGGLEKLSTMYNVPLSKIESFWRSKDDDMCRGRLDPQTFWQELKKEFTYTGEDINFIEFWIKNFKRIKFGHDFANTLSKDFQIGLLTNAYPNVIESVLGTDLMPQIKWVKIVKSCDYGFIKPEGELFKAALEKTGFKASEVMLIDDVENNCTKAEALGWKSLLFKPV